MSFTLKYYFLLTPDTCQKVSINHIDLKCHTRAQVPKTEHQSVRC